MTVMATKMPHYRPRLMSVLRSGRITTRVLYQFNLRRPEVVGLYWPFKGEYDPRAVAQLLHSQHVGLALPVVIERYGGETRPFYRIAAEGAAGCISGAQLVTIQGGRHLAPDAFNAALLPFLAKAGSQPKP